MKISEIVGMPAYKVNKLQSMALGSAYTVLRSAFNKRVKTFAKHDALRALPFQFRSGMPSARNLSDEEKLRLLKEASAFMRGSRSSYSGWKRSEVEQMESLNEMLKGDHEFKNLDDFRQYGEFMGEMQTRLGEMWKNVSSQVRELYFQSERLGVSSKQFLKNYEYWLAHSEQLQQAKKLEWSSSGRKVKASDYARQLKLPKMSEWYESQNYSHELSESMTRKGRKNK